jgi:hypothetical protein
LKEKVHRFGKARRHSDGLVTKASDCPSNFGDIGGVIGDVDIGGRRLYLGDEGA